MKASVRRWSLPFLGGLSWLLYVSLRLPASAYEISYVPIIFLAAALWLIPLTFKHLSLSSSFQILFLAAAILFAIGFLLPVGFGSAVFILPYLILQIFWLFREMPRQFPTTIASLFRPALPAFLLVAAIWALADRLDYRILGFDATIGLLTIAHFHYAGYLLTFLLKKLTKTSLHPVPSWVQIGILGGVPLIALGITTTQLGFPLCLEQIFVSIFVFAAVGFSIFQLRQGLKNGGLRKLLLVGSSVCLFVGMVLALAYSWRLQAYFPFINIPWMYAVHGTLNSFGFSFLGVLYYLNQEKIARKSSTSLA